jgi:hypothetical protein
MVIAASILLAAALFAYVFLMPGEVPLGQTKTRLAYLRERKDVVYDNLRDLNFEFKAGKFPEADYRTMRAQLEDEAALLLAEIERLEQVEGGGLRTA